MPRAARRLPRCGPRAQRARSTRVACEPRGRTRRRWSFPRRGPRAARRCRAGVSETRAVVDHHLRVAVADRAGTERAQGAWEVSHEHPGLAEEPLDRAFGQSQGAGNLGAERTGGDVTGDGRGARGELAQCLDAREQLGAHGHEPGDQRIDVDERVDHLGERVVRRARESRCIRCHTCIRYPGTDSRDGRSGRTGKTGD